MADASSSDVSNTDPDAASPECAPHNTTICVADLLRVCDDAGTVKRMETCRLGCASSADRCLDLDPSNGLASELEMTPTAPVVVFEAAATTTTINTDTGEVVHGGISRNISSTIKTQADLPSIRVFSVKRLRVENPIQVTGLAALAIVSDEDIIISAGIAVAASATGPGPGAIRTESTCFGTNSTVDGSAIPGPGGGSFGGLGARGGDALVNGATVRGLRPGSLAGVASLEPLRGGCGGGFFESNSVVLGAGGGAIQLSSRTRIDIAIAGIINAGGGGAGGFAVGGGGGSGGGILIEAPEVNIAGTVAANGGSGGCSNEPGQDATTTMDPAIGGRSKCGTPDYPNIGVGGNGATRTVAATAGGNAAGSATTVGGGGGGGLGRIRINTRTGNFTGSGTITPAESKGEARTR